MCHSNAYYISTGFPLGKHFFFFVNIISAFKNKNSLILFFHLFVNITITAPCALPLHPLFIAFSHHSSRHNTDQQLQQATHPRLCCRHCLIDRSPSRRLVLSLHHTLCAVVFVHDSCCEHCCPTLSLASKWKKGGDY